VVGEQDAVYVGSFTLTFGRRWLYLEGEYVYHHKAEMIAGKVREGEAISVWLVDEQTLQARVPGPFKLFINAQGV
jgi:hypothetical protein